jgi:signal transduction histidine kinase
MKHPTNLHDCQYELNRVNEILNRVRSHLKQTSDQQRRFAAVAAHELRTPVAGLRAQLEEARLHPGETPLPELLDYALKDVDRLQQIITDLLLLVQLETGTITAEEPLDLAELVRTQVGMRDDEIKVNVRLDSGAIVVNAVPSLIARAFTNLLDNAQRHAAQVVEVQMRRNDGSAELVITDDGPGIAAPDRESVFDAFTRLDTARDRDRGGTGLGLPLARNIAVVHDGTLVVEEAPRTGARFVLRLPLAAPGTRSFPPSNSTASTSTASTSAVVRNLPAD